MTISPAAAKPADVKPLLQSAPPRYHAFDCVRALAMLLGVFYHWQFVGGSMGMASGPKSSVDHWLHSFRMALFFLISGFFANMMLGKYGLWKYLQKRWWRIGMPLLVAILGFAALRFAQDYFPWAAAPVPGMNAFGGGFGAGGFGGGGFGGGPGGGFGAPNFGAPTFGGPPTNPFGPGAQPGAAPGGGFGAPAFGGQPGFAPGGTPGAAPGFGGGFPGYQPGAPGGGPARPVTPGQPPAATPNNPEAPAMPFAMGPAHPWADWLFGTLNLHATRTDGRVARVTADSFQLQHLWFLWYLLIFCTTAPLITRPLAWIFVRQDTPVTDRIGRSLVRWNLAPFLLALCSLPALLLARGTDWTLTNPAGFSGVFPDIFHQYFNDMPFYFLYFLFGWWFFRLRPVLNSVAKPWLFNLTLGITAFAIPQVLYDKYNPAPSFGTFPFPGFPGSPAAATQPQGASALVWLTAFGLYAVGSAYSGFGLLGFFQKYLDRPTKLGRYFTDTMLWVYLVQLAIIPYLANWVDYNNTSWWEATLGGVTLVTAVALVLFEIFVRHTPLIHIFGPASLGRRKTAASDAASM